MWCMLNFATSWTCKQNRKEAAAASMSLGWGPMRAQVHRAGLQHLSNRNSWSWRIQLLQVYRYRTNPGLNSCTLKHMPSFNHRQFHWLEVRISPRIGHTKLPKVWCFCLSNSEEHSQASPTAVQPTRFTHYLLLCVTARKLGKEESSFHVHFYIFLKAKRWCIKLEANKPQFLQWL